MKKGENYNRPQKGAQIRVDPVRSREDIRTIKHMLADNPRDLCLFTLGINTALRAGELLSIKVQQVKHLKPGDILSVWQTKTSRYRHVSLNDSVYDALQFHLQNGALHWEYLFSGQRGQLTVPTVNHKVKSWCRKVGLKGNFGSHTLRKTWGYHQYKSGANIVHLMRAFGHATEYQTLAYLGIQPEDIAALYELNL